LATEVGKTDSLNQAWKAAPKVGLHEAARLSGIQNGAYGGIKLRRTRICGIDRPEPPVVPFLDQKPSSRTNCPRPASDPLFRLRRVHQYRPAVDEVVRAGLEVHFSQIVVPTLHVAQVDSFKEAQVDVSGDDSPGRADPFRQPADD